jgi:Zn-dependent alcohol dehydrogenase
MVTTRTPLSGVNDAFAAMSAGEGVRTVLVFDQEA